MITTHPTVRQVMSKRVVTATEGTPFKELVQMMHSHSISAVPVVDAEHRLVGIVSETDLLLKEQHSGSELPKPHWLLEADRVNALEAKDVMTWPVLTVSGSASIAKAARIMREFGVRHLVVVSKGRPVGIVSRADLLRVFLRTDGEIKHQVLYGVADEMFSIDPAEIEVEVRDGVVTLSGELPDKGSRDLMVAGVKRLPGVVGVHSHLHLGPHPDATGGWPYEPPPDVDQEAPKR
jgi:CBS domain-containing protein